MDDGWRVDCFAVEEGNWDPRPANVCAIQAASRRGAKDRGDLYLLMQPAPQSVLSQTAIDALKASAIAGYYESAGSITRGLRAALVAGNAWLYEQNLRLDPDHRIALGLHYAVLRRQPGGASEVYLGQIGPALATWVHGSSVEQYPPNSIWLRSETPTLYDLDREPPAGWRREVEPNLYHITLAPGDTLVLSSPRLHHLVPPQALREALMLRGSASTLETLGKITQGRDLTVLVVEWGAREDRPAQGPLRAAVRTGSPAHKREERRPPLPTPAIFPAAESSAAATEPAESSSAEAPFAASPEAGGNAAETAPLEVGPSPSAGQAHPPTTATPAPGAPIRNQPLPEIDAVPHEGALPETDSVAPQEERGGMPPSLPGERLRENLTQGVERARQGTEELLTRVLPETTTETPAALDTGRRSLSLVGRALLGVSLAIPLVMACMVILTRAQYERAQRKVFTQIQSLAQARYDQAALMTNVPYRRKAMHEARATAREGLAIEPDDELLNSLLRQIEHNLDDIDGVVRLARFTQLADLGDDGSESADEGLWGSSARLIVQDLDLFLLSRNSGRVYRYLLNSAGDALEPAAGDAIMLRHGAIEEGVRIGELLDITWMEAEGQRTRDGFATLDRTGSLITYDLDRGIDVTPVANSDAWVKPIALGCYSGNVYVLDPILGAILKYIPTNNIYVNPPSNFINPQVQVDLTGAVDMAIDGSVYVLFADGKIAKFFKGDPQPFDMGGLPGAMRNPTILFVSGEKKPEAEGYVYVVDSGNQRILEFDKMGNYLRQFQAKAGLTQFQDIQGIHVDGRRGRLFLLSGNKLWFTNLPARKTSS